VTKDDYKAKMKKLLSTNTIGYRGVYKTGNRFRALIEIDGRKQHIGMFDTTKEAAIAYDFASIQAKRPKSELNFPDMKHTKTLANYLARGIKKVTEEELVIEEDEEEEEEENKICKCKKKSERKICDVGIYE